MNCLKMEKRKRSNNNKKEEIKGLLKVLDCCVLKLA